MHRSNHDILLSVILGLVIPSVLFSVFRNSISEKLQENCEKQPTINSTSDKAHNVSVLQEDGTVTIIELDDYLTGVLLREMPVEFEIEALKAQAVVARTYTLRRLDDFSKHNKAVVCMNSDCCQGYYSMNDYLGSGGSTESIKKITDAQKENKSGADYAVVTACENVSNKYRAKVNTEKAKEAAKTKVKGRTAKPKVLGEA